SLEGAEFVVLQHRYILDIQRSPSGGSRGATHRSLPRDSKPVPPAGSAAAAGKALSARGGGLAFGQAGRHPERRLLETLVWRRSRGDRQAGPARIEDLDDRRCD